MVESQPRKMYILMGGLCFPESSYCIAPQKKNDRKKYVLCSQHGKCNQFSNTAEPHYMDTHLEIQTPCSGLSKVAGYQWKSPPTWLVSAGSSSWHLFTDGVFWINIPGLADYFDNWAVYFKTFWQPCSLLWTVFFIPGKSPYTFPKFNTLNANIH